MRKYIVGKASDIPDGGKKLVDAGGRPIAVFNVYGEYYALHNKCPHEGASLCHGAVIGLIESTTPGQYSYSQPGTVLRCPWHGWEFDIKTGQSYCRPNSVQARSYSIAVESGDELVKGPFIAQTYEVVVENDYLVVKM